MIEENTDSVIEKAYESGKETISASEEILPYAVRLHEIGNELIITHQEIQNMKLLIGTGRVYEGEAIQDIYFYYNRLDEMVGKLANYYFLGDKVAREVYITLMKMDEYIADSYTL